MDLWLALRQVLCGEKGEAAFAVEIKTRESLEIFVASLTERTQFSFVRKDSCQLQPIQVCNW